MWKNRELLINLLGLVIPFALMIWIIISPLSLLYTSTYFALLGFIVFNFISSKNKGRWIEAVRIIWLILIAILTILNVLAETGRL
jgi:hypothetical protein